MKLLSLRFHGVSSSFVVGISEVVNALLIYLHLRDNRNIQQSGVLFVQLHEAKADMLAGRYVCLWL